MTRGVAAFDFDGTITKRDTLVPFLFSQGRARMTSAGAAGAVVALPHMRDHYRDRVKARVIRALFAGRPVDEVERIGQQYSETLPDTYRAATLESVVWHQEQGHERVLVTGSLGVYARPAAEALGFDRVIAVELADDGHGVLTGEMRSANTRGAEKERRLRELLGAEPYELWAYGNSSGDNEMLAMAHHTTWVK